jgi:hypothetical protein
MEHCSRAKPDGGGVPPTIERENHHRHQSPCASRLFRSAGLRAGSGLLDFSAKKKEPARRPALRTETGATSPALLAQSPRIRPCLPSKWLIVPHAKDRSQFPGAYFGVSVTGYGSHADSIAARHL